MTTTETSVTVETMLEVLGIGADEVFCNSGNYNGGFFRNELLIDLEELAGGGLISVGAFHILKDIHDTAGTSFREYYGIDYACKLPDGAKGSAIADVCLTIWNRRQELTAGFSVEWVNGNEKGEWDDDTEGSDQAHDWWSDADQNDCFATLVGDMVTAEVYDMSCDTDTVSTFYAAIHAATEEMNPEDVTAESIQEILETTYVSDSDTQYTGYADAAKEMFSRWQDEKE